MSGPTPVDHLEQDVHAVAAEVADPEMPMLTLADLGVLRSVRTAPDGTVVVVITPTYSGCPAVEEMRADLRGRLQAAGHDRVEVRTSFSPPWTTDFISDEGRRKLAEAGIAPPDHIGPRSTGPVPLTLAAPPKDRKSTRLNSSHSGESRMPSSA